MRSKVRTKKATAILLSVVFATVTLLSGAVMLFGFAAPTYSVTYTVDVSAPHQQFDGWGLSLSWWATEIGDWTRMGSTGTTKREELMEAIYGESGLNLNIARYNVGGGDNPTHTHMTDDRNTPGWRGATANEDGTYTPDENYFYTAADGSTLSWEQTPDYRQLWVLDWIQKNRNDVLTEYYSNSPPYWLTKSGCSSGAVKEGNNLNKKDNLADNFTDNQNLINDYEHNQAFVEYLLDVYEYLVGQGFTFENIQPFNESSNNYWYWAANGDQEGCHFSAQQQVEILHLLDLEMQKRGINAAYNVGDETNTNYATAQYRKMRNATASDGTSGADVLGGAGRLTYHIYDYNSSGVKQMYLNGKNNNQEVYMSEICFTVDGDGYDPNALATGFKYTQSIIDTVKTGYVDGYVFWQGIEDMVGQMKSGTNYGLIQGVYYTQEEAEAQGVDLASMGMTYQDYVLSKAYYMSGQYTKYIQPGYTIVDIDDATSMAALSPDGKTLVVVKQNNSANTQSVKIEFPGFTANSVEKIVTDANSNWAKTLLSTDGAAVYDTVGANSVTTYVLHSSYAAGTGHFIDDSQTVQLDSIDAIMSALDANGNVEQVYGTFVKDNNGGDFGYFNTNYNHGAAQDYWAFRFYGVGFDLLFPKKNDAGALNIWIDKEPAMSVPTDGSVDLKSSKQVNSSKVYSATDLKAGWHTVYVRVASGYVNFDGIIIHATAAEIPGNESLVINEAAGVNGAVHFTFTAQGYDGYELYAEYRNVNASAWTRGAQSLTVQDGVGKGEIATGATAYDAYVRLAAVKDGNAVYSPLMPVAMLAQTDGVRYFVNCGTWSGDSLSAGAVLGTLQSSSDRAYGEDLVTGKRWGYTNTSKSGDIGYNGAADAMTAMMHREFLNEEIITYRFALDAGSYKIAVGFYGGGTGWGSRNETVSMKNAASNGAGITEASKQVTLNEGEYTAVYFDATATTSGDIEIQVDGDMISVIAITDADTKLPLYASGGSNYNSQSTAKGTMIIGSDAVEEIAKQTSITVYLSDGSADTITAATGGVNFTVQLEDMGENKNGIVASKDVVATFTAPKYPGMELYAAYTWQQEGAVILYYNIDCGFIDANKTPPDDGKELGTLQSTTRDQVEHEDPVTHTTWGYDGKNPGSVRWGNDASADWSIRGDAGDNLKYTMTGFAANEPLTIKVSGHIDGGWGTRTTNVKCNGTLAGTYTLTDKGQDEGAGATFNSGTFECQADSNGKLEVKFTSASGGDPQVSYIKVWSRGATPPAAATITSDKTTVSRQDVITLGNLDTDATVYVMDENDVLLGSFTPAATTQQIQVDDYLPADSYTLRFVQAVKVDADAGKGAGVSAELIVSAPGVTYSMGKDFVRGGNAAVITFLPHTEFGVTALTLTTPDGVVIDLTEGFFYRALKNGTYTVTLTTGGMTTSQTFTVDTIDVVDFGETFSTSDWTRDNVTVTLAPTAASGIQRVFVNDEQVQLTGGAYEIVAQENGVYTVRVVTNAGFSYEKEIAVTNIDKNVPAVNMGIDFTASSVQLGYTVNAVSGGNLMMSYNDGAAQAVTDVTVSLDRAGKYQLYFENALGERTQTQTYYVSFGEANAVLGTVSVSAKGVVSSSVSGAALYRAGESQPIQNMTADKAGRYYLQLQKDGATEVVVLNIASSSDGKVIDIGDTSGSGSMGGMIAGLVIGLAAIVAAAIVCPLLIVKRRKNA